jgi:hypothetical protein
VIGLSYFLIGELLLNFKHDQRLLSGRDARLVSGQYFISSNIPLRDYEHCPQQNSNLIR